MFKFAKKAEDPMVFDWDKAARMIKRRKTMFAYAGLDGDWKDTHGIIWNIAKGIIDNSQMFLASTWAKPSIELGSKIYPCFRMKSETPGWDELTVWPDSARAIINKTPSRRPE